MSADDLGGIRVLIVDDSLFMRKMLRKKLEARNIRVIGEAEDGLRAFEEYKKLTPDIVLLDIVMPKADGIKALKLIRGYDPTAKVIMLTAIGQEKLIKEARELGAVGYIVKPFDEDNLIKTIMRVMRDRG
ncbi:MAG: response regulator [Thermoprotei archaeon]|nr:response regulator [Thermoprotei archaeon]